VVYRAGPNELRGAVGLLRPILETIAAVEIMIAVMTVITGFLLTGMMPV
jgi:hypothetical protein